MLNSVEGAICEKAQDQQKPLRRGLLRLFLSEMGPKSGPGLEAVHEAKAYGVLFRSLDHGAVRHFLVQEGFTVFVNFSYGRKFQNDFLRSI